MTVHESSVKRWCNSGDLPCSLTDGGHRRINLNEAISFARSKGLDCQLIPFGEHAEAVWDAQTQLRRKKKYTLFQDLLFLWLRTNNRALPPQLLKYLRQLGYQRCEIFDKLVHSVMTRVGNEWHSSTIGTGREHLMTGLIMDILRYECMQVIQQKQGSPNRVKRAIVGCAGGNDHEMGALMIRILLEELGWEVLYIGQSIPNEEYASIQLESKAELVCVSLSQLQGPPAVRTILRVLSQLYDRSMPYKLALGGSSATDYAQLVSASAPFKEVGFFESCSDFNSWISEGPLRSALSPN